MLQIPLQVTHLIPVIDTLLIELLQSLTSDEWNAPTIARQWTVKDIAAHLLDGNVRNLSASRDKYRLPAPANIYSYNDLVVYLNHLNHSWTDAAKRLSPQVITTLLEITGKQYADHLAALAPFDEAVYAVVWAGDAVSPNWFHIAREYTEKFLHQQQIRDATGKEALFTKELFHPFIHTFMYALPYTYRNVQAPVNTIVTVQVTTAAGGQWSIAKNETGWELTGTATNAAATVTMDPATAWKLFSKGITANEALPAVTIEGNKELGTTALSMIAVMA